MYEVVLDIIDIVLGATTIYLMCVVGRQMVSEILERRAKRKILQHKREEDTLVVTNVGITMADGGEPLDQKSGKEKRIYVAKNGKIRSNSRNSKEIDNHPDPG